MNKQLPFGVLMLALVSFSCGDTFGKLRFKNEEDELGFELMDFKF